MLKKLFTKVAHKFYFVLKKNYDLQNNIQKDIFLKSVCIKGNNTKIGEEAIIQNATGNNTKIRIGDNCWIKGYLLVYNHDGRIEIGDDSFIGPDCRIWSAKKIKIGNRVLISHNVNIHDNNSHPLNSKLRHEDFAHIFSKGLQAEIDLREAEIVIEDDVWIGFNVTILKGVKIGRGAIIGAGAFITEDVPPYAVVVSKINTEIIKYTD